ncbi:hypothetical protein LTS09_017778 [Friedmanniomyces endolithicus]|nr:hypothetical protein LTS09_017778 [Friedmanniomyces endolithicus]
MSPEERLSIFHHQDVYMAHLRLARWLHIHKLYEELSRHIGGRDVGGFVVMTDADLGQTLGEPRALAGSGNPRNLERASIAERMMDHAGGSNGGGAEKRKSKNSVKRLRRTGQRLRGFSIDGDLGAWPCWVPASLKICIHISTDECESDP